jgi:hypothetical protein
VNTHPRRRLIAWLTPPRADAPSRVLLLAESDYCGLLRDVRAVNEDTGEPMGFGKVSGFATALTDDESDLAEQMLEADLARQLRELRELSDADRRLAVNTGWTAAAVRAWRAQAGGAR